MSTKRVVLIAAVFALVFGFASALRMNSRVDPQVRNMPGASPKAIGIGLIPEVKRKPARLESIRSGEVAGPIGDHPAPPPSHPLWPGAKILGHSESAPLDGLVTRSTLLQPTNFPYAITIEEKLNGLEADKDRVVQRFESVANHLLVKLRPGAEPTRLAAIAQQFGATTRPHPTAPDLYFVDLAAIQLGAVLNAQAILLQYRETVMYAEPDAIVRAAAAAPDDIRFSEQWGLQNTGQNGGTAGIDIGAMPAWELRRDAAGVIVAVVDSGIRYSHEDIAANMWHNPGEIPDNRKDDDNNGVVDDVHGINAIDDTGDPNDDLPNEALGIGGHGTSVAGIIGAVGNNQKGIAGVAWKVQLMALKWFNNQGAGALSDAIECMDYARTHGATIVNASWQQGGLLATTVNESIMEALERLRHAGIIFVASAGNDGANNDFVAHYPSNYPFDNMIAVAAGTRDGALWRKSNFGERLVDIAAPGENILAPTSKSDDSYELVSGTSFAAPHVSGMLALLRAQFPNADYQALIHRVLSSAERRERLEGKVRTGAFAELSGALQLPEIREFPEIQAVTINGASIEQPEITVQQGTNVAVTVTAKGAAPLAYIWRRDGRVLNGVTTSNFVLQSFATSDIGQYQVAVSNVAGVATLSFRLLGLVDRPQLAAAVNAPLQAFASTGNALWDGQNAVSRDGVSAGVTGRVTGRQGSVASTTITGPGKLSFAWSVSSERDNDTLDFFIDDVRIESISGEVAWVKREFEISPGLHSLRWSYVKDASLSKGADKGYLDLFEFTPNGKTPPSITVQPLSQTVLEGASVFLTVVATGSGPIVYQWHKDGAPIAGANANRLEVPGVTPADAGRYFATVQNEAGTARSTSAHLTITPAPLAPRITEHPSDLTLEAGGTARFRVAATGTQPLRFQWRKGADALAGQTNDTLTLPSVRVEESGDYTVALSNSAGTVVSRIARLMVAQVQLAPVISKQPASQTLNQGAPLELGVEVNGLGPFTYSWSHNGQPLAGQNSAELIIPNVAPTDTGSYQVRVTSPFGETTSIGVFVQVEVSMPAFQDAVEIRDFVWLAGGDEFWFRQTEISFDGEDALQSGRIEDSQFSSVSATALGPGQVSFYWKVSSEAQYDFLEFYVDGQLIDLVSGDWDWEEVIWNIPEGTHTLSWIYVKDETLSDGADAAWLDRVAFVSFNTESPVVLHHPQHQSSFLGGTVVFETEAAGSPQLSYQWFKGETLLPTATGSSLTVSNITLVADGAYHVMVSNRFGVARSRDAFLYVLEESIAVEAALNYPGLTWTNHGFASWYPQTDFAADLSMAMQTPPLNDEGIGWLSTAVEGPGVLSFYWKVSSEENYDFLEFLIDGELTDFISGEVDWRSNSMLIPPGPHYLHWIYLKDETDSSGADAGWLDSVEYIPIDALLYWKYGYFTADELLEPQTSGDEADPDKDGRNNLLEYAFGLDPRSGGDPLPLVSSVEVGPGGSYLLLTYLRRTGDPFLQFELESSSNLKLWNTADPTAWSEAAKLAGDFLEIVQLRSLKPLTDATHHLFFRVRVSMESIDQQQ